MRAFGVAAGVGAHLEDLAARGVQHAQRLTLATLARGGELVTCERFPPSPDRIQRVALDATAAAGPLGPVDLDHPLALGAQEGRQPGALAAGALQRPDPTAGRPLCGDGEQPSMPGLVGSDLQVGADAAAWVQHGGGVGVAVGVDPDDVVEGAL
jgi:hypothetical protein